MPQHFEVEPVNCPKVLELKVVNEETILSPTKVRVSAYCGLCGKKVIFDCIYGELERAGRRK
jgi:hypothetical protein